MMAESPAERRFKNEEYGNWFKLTHALICLAEGLRPFCERTIGEFHNTLRTQIGTEQCIKCTYKRIRKHESVEGENASRQAECNMGGTSEGSEEPDTDTNAQWYIVCPNDICNKWLHGIIAGLCGGTYSWKNTDVKKWPKQPWQLAKLFMGAGQQPSTSKSEKTDALGLLQLITRCTKLFGDHVDTETASKVMFCFYVLINKPLP